MHEGAISWLTTVDSVLIQYIYKQCCRHATVVENDFDCGLAQLDCYFRREEKQPRERGHELNRQRMHA